MKHMIIYCLIFVIGSISFLSCNSLDLYPEDWNSGETFWKNDSQIEGYILGLHSDLREAYTSFYILGECRGGTLKSGTSFIGTSLDNSSPIKTNMFSKHQTGVENWNGLYSQILNTNIFISNVEDGCDFLGEVDRNYYLGQAYGLRALYYFLLYRTFGGLPIIDKPYVLEGVTDASNLYAKRSSAKATMDFIKENIRKSETFFGDNNQMKKEKGMWSKYATLMLKAEVYLWSAKVSTEDQRPDVSDIQTARVALQPIMTTFSLLSNFAEVFQSDNKGNDEIIFAIRFVDGEKTNWINLFVYDENLFKMQFYGNNKVLMGDTLAVKGSGLLRHEYKWGLFASMDDSDARKRATFLDCYDKDGMPVAVVLRKFMGIINDNGNRSYCDDFVVYRYADALLMMAEIENMQGGDVARYINKIRERAYGPNYIVSVHGYKHRSFAENELAILKERDKEFVYEGKRWFDLLRLQDASKKPLAFSADVNYDNSVPVIKPGEAYKLLWPIDVNTLNNDPELVNNPGYEN